MICKKETIDIIIEIIEQLKNNQGIKQSFIAQKCDFNEKDFSKLLNKKRKVTALDIKKFSIGLERTPNDFFDLNIV